MKLIVILFYLFAISFVNASEYTECRHKWNSEICYSQKSIRDYQIQSSSFMCWTDGSQVLKKDPCLGLPGEEMAQLQAGVSMILGIAFLGCISYISVEYLGCDW